MIRVLVLLLLITVVALGSAMVRQHGRYQRVRHDLAHDRQPALYGTGAFHALVFLATRPGDDVFEAVREWKHATAGSPASWIYVGKTVATPLASSQIGEKDWSAIALLQYPSREAYDRHSRSEPVRKALGRFAEVYAQGFQRPMAANVMVPQGLLALRATQLLRGRPSHFPFTPAEDLEALPLPDEAADRLAAARELGAEAIVIVNLIRGGSAAERAADRRYALAMFGAMAEGGYGPLHVGRAVRIERDYDFETVALVFYPGVDFFADMVRSEYFQGIVGDKQLGDTQAVITVPILERL